MTLVLTWGLLRARAVAPTGSYGRAMIYELESS